MLLKIKKNPNPVNNHMFKVTIGTLEQGVRYVQS